MMRASASNRLGVLLGISWPTSCPHGSGLRVDAVPMRTLVPAQGDVWASAHVPRASPTEKRPAGYASTPDGKKQLRCRARNQRSAPASVRSALSADRAGSPEHPAPAHAAIRASRWRAARPPRTTTVVPTHASCTPAQCNRRAGALPPAPCTQPGGGDHAGEPRPTLRVQQGRPAFRDATNRGALVKRG